MIKSTVSSNIYAEQILQLRKEIMDTINHQIKYIQLGMLCIAGAFTFILNSTNITLTFISKAVLIPLICYTVLCMWLGEVGRMMTYGNYIRNIEAQIMSNIEDYNNIEFYETWLHRTQSKYMLSLKYIAVIASFTFLSVASSILSFYESTNDTIVILSIAFNIIGLVGITMMSLGIYRNKSELENPLIYIKTSNKRN